MSISPGQPVSAAVVNSNFISSVDANTGTISIVALSNTDPASGDVVANLQAAVNGNTFTIYAEEAITSNGTISVSGTQGLQYRPISGSGAAVVANAVPFGAGPFLSGTIMRLIGYHATNSVTIQNNDAAGGAILNGSAALFEYDSIDLMYDSVKDRWIEVFRNF